MTETPQHYQEPGWFTRNVFNKAVAACDRPGHPHPGLADPGRPGP